ncbi:aminopeptidase P N-terminal domain-containing protein [Candidatus Sulfurimonas marisnigri]|uniref:Xaa-Pro aminopeptidase n=1 Tax=Candidatus Sulfurimonas marisnigri TaxID=2740405 RepID=A0A7S7LZ58_9BACT|nr:aminopeptidase P N-terminal domain-containing protein [Candidatus Sulfurimonas marisnigri]QOY54145.1 aminopeptidase P N-terminal domain-containing protein [Candidatus Sulfurimonas marisnigri]
MITENEYKKRRDKLAKKLYNSSVGVIFSATCKTRSNDTEYPYRQNSDFYYLTGFREDNASLVFIKEKESVKTVIFLQKKDEQLELWNGKRLGVKEAKKRFFVDEIYTTDYFKKSIKEYLANKKYLYYDLDSKDKRLKKVLKLSKEIKTFDNIVLHVQKMRLVKSTSEINLINRAVAITTEAHNRAMRSKKIGKNEFELQAEIEYEFKKNGAYSDAYTSIVACGNSANTLHYIDNNQPLVDGELILIDAGCEYEYYASDITRTIPVSGVFTKAQKELYSLILNTQLEIIEMIKPNVKRSDLQAKAEILLTKGMVKLGILKGDYKELIKNKKHKKYYPHGIGHWMGLDVHDTAPYLDDKKKEIPLKKGMVLTIEPGLYIDKDDKNVPKEYRGIGIRIEDDILVTQNGYKNLSIGIAKTIEEIESISSSNYMNTSIL